MAKGSVPEVRLPERIRELERKLKKQEAYVKTLEVGSLDWYEQVEYASELEAYLRRAARENLNERRTDVRAKTARQLDRVVRAGGGRSTEGIRGEVAPREGL